MGISCTRVVSVRFRCAERVYYCDASELELRPNNYAIVQTDRGQGLAGQCGRLRWCLKYEYEQYLAINQALPKIGEEVGTPFGDARVVVGHRMKETVSLRYDKDTIRELPLAEITRYATSTN